MTTLTTVVSLFACAAFADALSISGTTHVGKVELDRMSKAASTVARAQMPSAVFAETLASRIAKRANITVSHTFCARTKPATPPDGPTLKFYMYKPELFTSWSLCDREKISSNKHAHAVLLVEHLLNSPWRTDKMEEAQLFVVPALIDWVSRGKCGSMTPKQHFANIAEVIRHTVAKGLHIVVTGDFMSESALHDLSQLFPKLAFGIYMNYSDVPMNECNFRLGFTTDYDVSQRWPIFDRNMLLEDASRRAVGSWTSKDRGLAELNATANEFEPAESVQSLIGMRGLEKMQASTGEVNLPTGEEDRVYNVEFCGQCDRRTGYMDRWKLMHTRGLPEQSFVTTSTSPTESELFACHANQSMYCSKRFSHKVVESVRSKAEFSVMLRGDDPASDRLQNAMSMLSIPVIVEDVSLNWLPLRHAVKWDDLLVKVTRKDFDANASSAVAAAIKNIKPTLRKAMRQKLLDTRKDLLYCVDGSRAAERFLQAALLETESCRTRLGAR